jgi:hypothetical protein
MVFEEVSIDRTRSLINRTLFFLGTGMTRWIFPGSRRPATNNGKEGANSKVFFCSTIEIEADGAFSARRLETARPPIPQPRTTTLSFDGKI